jgi:hypothetical protein
MALRVTARTTFPFDPLREPPRLHDEITAKLCQAANAALPQNPCACGIPVLEQKTNEGGRILGDNWRRKPHKRRRQGACVQDIRLAEMAFRPVCLFSSKE